MEKLRPGTFVVVVVQSSDMKIARLKASRKIDKNGFLLVVPGLIKSRSRNFGRGKTKKEEYLLSIYNCPARLSGSLRPTKK